MEILLKPKETGYTVAQGEAREGNREPNVAESEDKRVVHEALVTASLYKFSPIVDKLSYYRPLFRTQVVSKSSNWFSIFESQVFKVFKLKSRPL